MKSGNLGYLLLKNCGLPRLLVTLPGMLKLMVYQFADLYNRLGMFKFCRNMRPVIEMVTYFYQFEANKNLYEILLFYLTLSFVHNIKHRPHFCTKFKQLPGLSFKSALANEMEQ